MKALFLTLLLFASLPLFSGVADAASATPDAAEGTNKLTMITEKFGVELPTLIAQMVNFGLVAFVLYRFVVRPISDTLDDRQQKIADGLQYAEEMKVQLAAAERERSEKIKEATTEAQKILAESRELSKQMIEDKAQEATAHAEVIIRKAHEATELERQKMLSDVRHEVARLVVKTSSVVLSRDLSSDEKEQFSNTAASELAKSI